MNKHLTLSFFLCTLSAVISGDVVWPRVKGFKHIDALIFRNVNGNNKEIIYPTNTTQTTSTKSASGAESAALVAASKSTTTTHELDSDDAWPRVKGFKHLDALIFRGVTGKDIEIINPTTAARTNTTAARTAAMATTTTTATTATTTNLPADRWPIPPDFQRIDQLMGANTNESVTYLTDTEEESKTTPQTRRVSTTEGMNVGSSEASSMSKGFRSTDYSRSITHLATTIQAPDENTTEFSLCQPPCINTTVPPKKAPDNIQCFEGECEGDECLRGVYKDERYGENCPTSMCAISAKAIIFNSDLVKIVKAKKGCSPVHCDGLDQCANVTNGDPRLVVCTRCCDTSWCNVGSFQSVLSRQVELNP